MLEKEKTINKYLKNHKTISIIGLSKNAGKTTVLNRLIEELKSQTIAITSIGLDGEKIDNVNYKPKPRIKVYKGMLIATATDCLIETEIKYVVHEKTSINTALGLIVIIEAMSDGYVLVAGPSTKTKMKEVIKRLKKYEPNRIFLDGALFRKSFSVYDLVDAMILVTGASYSRDMNKTINHTRNLIDQLDLPCSTIRSKYDLIDVDSNGYNIDSEFSKDKVFEYIISNKIKLKYARIHGAITNRITDNIILNREYFVDCTVHVDDSISFICDIHKYELLKKLNIKFEVENSVPVLFLAINPYSPTGYEYDNEKFKKLLQQHNKLHCINVLADLE